MILLRWFFECEKERKVNINFGAEVLGYLHLMFMYENGNSTEEKQSSASATAAM